MKIQRCMKCMHELRADETFCPECGQKAGTANTESFALRPGTILDGKYLVGEMLGQGGFGITYIGFDLLLEQKVAIKEYFPMSSGMVSRENSSTVVWSSTMMVKTGTEKGFDSFLKEARKMAKLGSIPGVVGVKSVFIENETAYIVMDYVEGETLLKRLQREGPMNFNTCVTLLTPIMQALEEVHKHSVIHRDISPDNIMVKPDGSLVLLDLGAAKDLELKNSDGTTQHSSQLVAKHGFSPVEQYIQSSKITPATDVYAMAATIYYCCTGIVPPAAVDRMMEDTLSCQPRLNQKQFEILAEGMRLRAENRPQNMGAWLQMLCSRPEPKPPRPNPRPEPPKPNPAPPKTEPPVPVPPKPKPPKHKGIAAVIATAALLFCVNIGASTFGNYFAKNVYNSKAGPTAAISANSNGKNERNLLPGSPSDYNVITSEEWERQDNDDVNRMKIRYERNCNNDIVRETSYFPNGEICLMHEYQFDENGRTVSGTCTSSVSGLLYTIQYEYPDAKTTLITVLDPSGKKLEQRKEELAVVGEKSYTLTNLNTGKVLDYKYYSDTDFDGYENGVIFYSYRTEGDTEIRTHYTDGKLRQENRAKGNTESLILFNDQGMKTYERNDTYNNANVCIRRETHSFDDNGKQTSSTCDNYNDRGEIIELIMDYSFLKSNSKYSYQYDQLGRIAKQFETTERKDDSILGDSTTETDYYYDSLGQLIKTVAMSSRDGYFGRSISETIYEYEYDQNGFRTTSGYTYEGDLQEKTVDTFDPVFGVRVKTEKYSENGSHYTSYTAELDYQGYVAHSVYYNEDGSISSEYRR